MIKPSISVIMSVYNNEEKHLRKAIESILNQTYSNFEFIIIDDASDKSIRDIIESYKDRRIVYLRNKLNIGLTKSLNKALDIAQGKYIARMDADDISLSKRLEKQHKFMEKNSNIGVVGTQGLLFGNKKGVFWYPSDHEKIKCHLLLNSAVIHPSAMIRANIIKKEMYNESYITGQDYELWSRLIWSTEFANMNQFLFKYRFHENQISKSNSVKKQQINQIRISMISKIYPHFTKNEMEILLKSANCEILILEDIKLLKKLSEKLIKENQIFDSLSLIKTLSVNLDRVQYIHCKNSNKKVEFFKLEPKHILNKFTFLKSVYNRKHGE